MLLLFIATEANEECGDSLEHRVVFLVFLAGVGEDRDWAGL